MAARDKLASYRKWSEEDIKDQIGSAGHESAMLIRIITQGDRPSLRFVNELYLVRHLLTRASLRLTSALELTDKTSPDDVRARDEALRGARKAYQAGVLSIDAATKLLPRKFRTIKREDFWSRINRLSGEREAEAEKFFIDQESKNSGTEKE